MSVTTETDHIQERLVFELALAHMIIRSLDGAVSPAEKSRIADGLRQSGVMRAHTLRVDERAAVLVAAGVEL